MSFGERASCEGNKRKEGERYLLRRRRRIREDRVLRGREKSIQKIFQGGRRWVHRKSGHEIRQRKGRKRGTFLLSSWGELETVPIRGRGKEGEGEEGSEGVADHSSNGGKGLLRVKNQVLFVCKTGSKYKPGNGNSQRFRGESNSV